MSIIEQAANYLHNNASLLTEALSFKETPYGSDPQNPINKLFDHNNYEKFTYLVHEKMLFKLYIKLSHNEICFGVHDPSKTLTDIKPTDFLTGEKINISINMISFWSKMLYIWKQFFKTQHYNYMTFSTTSHTFKLYSKTVLC